LTDKGWSNANQVTALLRGEGIDLFASSPYKRAMLTIEQLANTCEKEIAIYEDLRETVFSQEGLIRSDKELYSTIKMMFEDTDFSLPGGESCTECTNRAIGALETILGKYPGRKIVIGTHGMVMTLLLRHFDRRYDYKFLMNTTKPDVYKMEFDNGQLAKVERIWGRSTDPSSPSLD
jgi:2,3-bisphosphoglycerate-dependent phosphoglycerate mutase